MTPDDGSLPRPLPRSITRPRTRPLARAEAAVLLSGTDPRLALAEARAVLALTGWPEPAGASGEVASVALRAAALAARELGDLDLAEGRLREAITAGRGHPRRVAQARMSLVTVRAQLGDPEGGLRLADLAERDLAGTDLARLDVQRSVALMLLGRHAEAVRHCDRAIDRLEQDPRFRAGGLLNRGLARAYLEEYGAAEADLTACARIAEHAGLDHIAMLAAGNLPFVAARCGDVAGAFTRYQAAEAMLAGFPERLAVMRTDFAEALVAARLPGEARTLLEQAVPDLVAAGAQAAVPGARLLLAQAALLAGDAGLAETTADTAFEELRAQGRTSWLPLAREVVLRARLAGAGVTPDDRAGPPGCDGPCDGPCDDWCGGLIGEMATCADDLAASGWPAAASALRLTTAAAAVRRGAIALARAQLGLVATTAARPLVRWHAVAMRHRLDGDLGQALAAAARGIRAVRPGGAPHPADGTGGTTTAGTRPPRTRPLGGAGGTGAYDEERARLCASVPRIARDAELRAYAARPAEDLAAFGLEVALDLAGETGDARTVLEWAERWRAVARGTPAPALPRPGALPAGTGLLVELVRRGDDLFAVTAGPEGCVLRAVGSYQTAVEATVRIRYGLRRRGLRDADALPRTLPGTLAGKLAGTPPGPLPDTPPGAFSAACAGAVERELAALDHMLLAGPGTLVCGLLRASAGPVTIVPTGALCTLPWPLLPSLRGRPVSVAADARAWAAARPYPAGDPLVLAVAGPGLPHAAAEADMVAATHRRARRVGATRAEMLRALERADVLHVAAHGMFSPRGPMLSQVTLDDGPLMAYDLLTVRRIPRVVVLSACDAGMAHAPVDGAALGLAGTFLDRACQLGEAACVIASVVPVRDEEALTLMTLFHTLLAEGRSPADALTRAAGKAAVPGFVCFGRGDQAFHPAARNG